MKEGKAPPVFGLQPPAQIVPVLDFVHRFISDDLLQDRGRAVPADLLHDQKTAVEPASEQMQQVVVCPREMRVVLQKFAKVLAHPDDPCGGAGGFVQAAEQALARGFASFGKRSIVLGRRRVAVGFSQIRH